MIPGEWKEELEFREIKNVSTTILPRSAQLFDSRLNNIIMLIELYFRKVSEARKGEQFMWILRLRVHSPGDL